MSEHEDGTDRGVNATDHALLVIWGQYAQCLGIPQGFAKVRMKQKTVKHTPQSKVLEFLVAQLAGLEYMKDISRSAHPLDQDRAVAQAWGAREWADYSGVSRTMRALTEREAAEYIAVLEGSIQAMIDGEVQEALSRGGVILDGDLTPRRVSDSSRTYPEASFGYMQDTLHLGYQVGVISMSSTTYGRLGLSACRYTGKTVSVTQAESLALEAKRRLGRRPLRRTDLLEQRLAQRQLRQQEMRRKVIEADQRLAKASQKATSTAGELERTRVQLAKLEVDYQTRHCPERPNSQLARVRQRTAVLEKRDEQLRKNVIRAQAWFKRRQECLVEWKAETAALGQRHQCFQTENATNAHPIQAVMRLDAGFGDHRNLALLIEMGYEIYTKPFGHWLSGKLSKMSLDRALSWQKVSQNAELMAWKAVQLADFPYPLDLGYERFWQKQADGQSKLVFSALVHFGPQDVCADLLGWFHRYNARQSIEAANKEVRQVFEAQHIKVRTLPAMRLQEYFALFAANFVRFAALWLANQCPQVPDGWQVSHCPRVKEQVKVGAHSPAQLVWFDMGCLVRFTDRSVYAGRSLFPKRQVAIQLTLRI